jgi:hypothetical protein
MRAWLLPLAAVSLLAAGCGDDDDAEPRRTSATATVQVRATSGAESRLLGPTSTCATGAPSDIRLACGIPAAHPRVEALPVRPGAPIALRFEAGVDRLLVQQKRGAKSEPVVELSQLEPATASADRRRWTVPAPPRLPRHGFLGLVAIYAEPVFINHLTTGGTVPLDDAVLQFQLPLRQAP